MKPTLQDGMNMLSDDELREALKKREQYIKEKEQPIITPNKEMSYRCVEAKTYGKQTVDIPIKLKNIIAKWARINPTEYLLFDSNMNKLSAVKLNQRLNKIFNGKKGKYIPLVITLNDDLDQFGNQGPVCVDQTKEERDAKTAKTYLGNVKVVWTNGENVDTAPRDGAGSPPPKQAPIAEPANTTFTHTEGEGEEAVSWEIDTYLMTWNETDQRWEGLSREDNNNYYWNPSDSSWNLI